MFQNRVNPLGEIISTAARWSWMGNRGVIHNEHKKIVRDFKHKAWIICRLEFKGRKRTVMTANRWTELFFLDEATALAAGHRPCFECRRDDALRFKSFWISGNPEYQFTMSTSISEFDELLHRERLDGSGQKVTHSRKVTDIPDGVFVLFGNKPYLWNNGQLHSWTPFGYEGILSVANNAILDVLTPNSIVNAIKAGYKPHVKY